MGAAKAWPEEDWEMLVSSLFCDISRCCCGVYSVRVEKTTIQLTGLQFGQIARAFKLAYGMASAIPEPHETDDAHPEHAIPFGGVSMRKVSRQ